VVIKSQIDYIYTEGKQFAWRTYFVNSSAEFVEIDYRVAYEGSGQMHQIDARDALEKYLLQTRI